MVSVGHDVVCNIKVIAERHIVFDAFKYLYANLTEVAVVYGFPAGCFG